MQLRGFNKGLHLVTNWMRMFPGIFAGEGIFIIPLLFVARGGTAHPFAIPAALQAAECLTPQAPERLIPAT